MWISSRCCRQELLGWCTVQWVSYLYQIMWFTVLCFRESVEAFHGRCCSLSAKWGQGCFALAAHCVIKLTCFENKSLQCTRITMKRCCVYWALQYKDHYKKNISWPAIHAGTAVIEEHALCSSFSMDPNPSPVILQGVIAAYFFNRLMCRNL